MEAPVPFPLRRLSCLAAAVVSTLLLLTSAASAQPGAARWNVGTTVNVFGGAATDSTGTGVVGGGSLGWEVTPRIAVEGSGAWFRPGGDTRGFSAALKGQFGLPVRERVVPFAEAGIGLYRAVFEPGAAGVPPFYANRMTSTGPLATHDQTFTDPAFVVGAGISLFANRHFAVRPDVETMVIRHGGESHVVTSFAIRLAYHFEDHPVTP
jgi:hypothetical protein